MGSLSRALQNLAGNELESFAQASFGSCELSDILASEAVSNGYHSQYGTRGLRQCRCHIDPPIGTLGTVSRRHDEPHVPSPDLLMQTHAYRSSHPHFR
jgi:hypothetical protein